MHKNNPLFRMNIFRTGHNSWCGPARLLDRCAVHYDEPVATLARKVGCSATHELNTMTCIEKTALRGSGRQRREN